MLKDTSYPQWLLWAVIIGDGLFVVLQVPSPNFLGFGLTPFPLLAAETLAYFVGGYAIYRARVYTSKYLYAVCFGIVVVLCAGLFVFDLPATVLAVMQIVVYVALALLNLCWGVIFASFRPSVSVVLVIGSYIVWSLCSLLFSFGSDGAAGLWWLRILFPLVSLVMLGFCLAHLDFGTKQKRYDPDEKQESFAALLVGVKEPVLATVAFSFIFGSIMQMDIVQGASGYIVSPEAQIATIAVSVALLLYVLRDGMRVQFRILMLVPLALATVLMARAVFESQSFFTNGLPLALFNFFGQLVWVVFAWKGYESKSNSLCLFAMGLGSMRLGLLGGRGSVEALSNVVGISEALANFVSIIGLWALFLGVLVTVAVILKRQNAETTPFEPGEEGVAHGFADAGPRFGGGVPTVAGTAKRAEGADAEPFEIEAKAPDEYSLYERKFVEAVESAGLTERETEILMMYAGGRSAIYVAEELYLSNYTVKTHLRRCYAKLGIHSRQELLDLIWKGKFPSA
ncbi:MAG: helix-turn-helix transcriptional regulator [Gordonibacter sp.]|uniref:response regulator transcription factor n=1 Tax=Gordonibacter sp. TaxID=1968902 RepID=UPI002FCB000E